MKQYFKDNPALLTGVSVGIILGAAAFLNPFYLTAVGGFSVAGYTPFAFLVGLNTAVASSAFAIMTGAFTTAFVGFANTLAKMLHATHSPAAEQAATALDGAAEKLQDSVVGKAEELIDEAKLALADKAAETFQNISNAILHAEGSIEQSKSSAPVATVTAPVHVDLFVKVDSAAKAANAEQLETNSFTA